MTPEIANEAKELINALTPAITNMIQIKYKSLGYPKETFKMPVDATYADIVKTIYLATGFEFDVECEFFQRKP